MPEQVLVVDPLETWLMLLAATLFAAATYVYFNFVKPLKELEQANRGFGVFFTGVGIYALATGVWATITWPFPGPYNIVLMDPWAIFGLASLVLGLSLLLKIDFTYTSVPFAFLGILPVVHGLAILNYRLTMTPEFTFLMYFLTGLSVLLSPILFYKKNKMIAYIAVLFLVIAGLLALYIGANATFGHIPGWGKWSPWYGAVKVGG
jgi:putative membrane protein